MSLFNKVPCLENEKHVPEKKLFPQSALREAGVAPPLKDTDNDASNAVWRDCPPMFRATQVGDKPKA